MHMSRASNIHITDDDGKLSKNDEHHLEGAGDIEFINEEGGIFI